MLESEFIRFVKRGIVILSMLVTFSAASVAENVDWCFTHFTSENCGLSFDNVNAITQDSNGFVWVSTEDGLNRFDGSGFVAYYREQLGLNTDFITALCPDNEGNVWIGTDAGATFYSYADDSFHPLDKFSDNGVNIDNKVTHICIDKSGIVWLSVNGREKHISLQYPVVSHRQRRRFLVFSLFCRFVAFRQHSGTYRESEPERVENQ